MKYYVIEGRNIGTIGNPEIIESIMYVTDDKMEAARYEDSLRKTYKDRTIVDCWMRSGEEIEKAKRAKDLYNSLTEEQKHEYITVDGRKYIKTLYEYNNKNK